MSSHGYGSARAARANAATAARLPSPAIPTGYHPTTTIEPAAREALARAFGRTLSDRTIRAMAGAPPSAQVQVIARMVTGGVRYDAQMRPIFGEARGAMITWKISGPPLPPGQHDDETNDRQYAMHRYLEVRFAGMGGQTRNEIRAMRNNSFKIAQPLQGQGLGTTSLAAQVQTLTRLGVPAITTHAMRGSGYNGYKTWPELGYNGPLTRAMLRNISVTTTLHAATKERIARIQQRGGEPTIHDLIATPDGLAFWAKHGISSELSFTLTRGSDNRRWLAHYLRGRRAQGKHVGNPAPWRDI